MCATIIATPRNSYEQNVAIFYFLKVYQSV